MFGRAAGEDESGKRIFQGCRRYAAVMERMSVMNRIISLLLLLCLLAALSSCGGETVSPAAGDPPAQRADAPSADSPPADAEAPDAPVDGTPEETAAREAFAALLRQVHEERILPDGTELEGSSMEAVEGNLFALFDVDGDGQEELLLLWQNACTAGEMEIVYGYDTDSGGLREELREFPGVIFYDNGAAESPWSHNQGWAGEFWPYTLYQYRRETGDYAQAGGVDAWDRRFTEERLPAAFPADVDADGDGVVYFLLSGEWLWGEHTAPDGSTYSTWSVPPVDGSAYLRWRESYLAGADFLDLSFVPLTAENISEVLGVPFTALSDALLPDAAG